MSAPTCGCEAVTHAEAPDRYMVDHCPLHQAAEAMQAALVECSEWMREHTGPADGTLAMLTRAHDAVKAATGTVVTVQFHPLAWQRDNAIEVDPQGDTEFDVPVADAQDEQGRWLPDHSYESDRLQMHPNAQRWIREWSGPFDIVIKHA